MGWEELSAEIGPTHYTASNLPARLVHLDRDPWAGIGELRQKLPETIEKESASKLRRKTAGRKRRKPGT